METDPPLTFSSIPLKKGSEKVKESDTESQFWKDRVHQEEERKWNRLDKRHELA